MKTINFPATAGSRKMREKLTLNLFLIILSISFMFISSVIAEEPTEQAKITPPVQESRNTTRILISTSGPAKFTAHWLDNPPRLVIEFQTKNIVSKIDNELIVNEGGIKRITSEYFGSGQDKSLKSLTFELFEKVPYKIWQEDNNIILDIQSSLDIPMLLDEGKEVFAKDETKDKMIKRLEAMALALSQRGTDQILAEAPKLIASPKPSKKGASGVVLWIIGLTSIVGLGFLVWLFWRRYRLILDKNMAAQEIAKLKTLLEEQNKLLEQEEIIRKAIEKTAIEKEKEYVQLKLELDQKSRLFDQEATIRCEKEKALQELERERAQLKETSESLKDVLVKRGIAKELTTTEGKEELWILGKSQERRNSPRLILTKDFHNTVILKIELAGSLRPIKTFAENISSGGLCFQTQKELDDNYPIDLRLFFYGGKVPNFKTQGWIVWKRPQDSKIYYGITFEGLSEKVKSELQHYIEANK